MLPGVVHSAETVEVTEIDCVETSTQGDVPTVYVIGIAPDKPVGLNTFPVTPVPLQVPPDVPVNKVFRLMVPDASQMAPGDVHAGLTSGVTVILKVCASLQG